MSAELYLELIDGLNSKKPKTFLALASSGSEEVCDRLRKKFKNAVFIDICDGPSAGDIAADLTTIEDGGLAIIKDLQFASFSGEDSIQEIFETLFSNRELVLTLASGKKKSLELANFHIVCVCDGEIVLPEELYKLFDHTYKEDDECKISFEFDEEVPADSEDDEKDESEEDDSDEEAPVSLEGLTLFSAKPKFAAVWAFYPNGDLKAQYPDAENDDVSMDLQEEEILAIKPISTVKKGGDLVIELAEGRLQLFEFKQAWQEGIVPDDAIVWDIERIIEAWSSD